MAANIFKGFSKWPSLGAGNHGEGVKMHHEWFRMLVDELESLRGEVTDLKKVVRTQEDTIREQGRRIEELSGKAVLHETSKPLFSSLFTGDKGLSKDEVNILAGVARECQEAERKGKNVIVFGLSESRDGEGKDESKVAELMRILKVHDVGAVKRISRIGRPSNIVGEVPIKSRPLVVELVNDAVRLAVLKGSRLLRGIEEYRGVFVRPDLTTGQREAQKRLIEMRNARNKELSDTSDFYFGIRDGRIEKIRRVVAITAEKVNGAPGSSSTGSTGESK